MRLLSLFLISSLALIQAAQDDAAPGAPAAPPAGTAAEPVTYKIPAGKRIPLTVLKAVSTKNAAVGDPVYLETAFPIVDGNRILIPRGSYVSGTVLESKRAGKVKGRAQLRVRLDTLILPSGLTRDFRGDVGGLDANAGEKLNEEGVIQGKGSVGEDFKKVMTGAGYGAMAGGAVGLATIDTTGSSTNPNDAVNSGLRRLGRGTLTGMAAGAAAGYVVTLFLRGPDAILEKGADIEMELDRAVTFNENELPPSTAPPVAPGQPAVYQEPRIKTR